MDKAARIREIDLLRFAAAAVVVLFHYAFRGHAADGLSSMPYPTLAPIAKYGYLGVDLFFMISGFVILMSASAGTLRDFAISRAVRLYPAFWAACSITFLVLLLAGSTVFPVTVPQYLVNLTMLNGFLGVPSIDGVYWSLFIELQFYFMVAVVLASGRIGQAEILLVVWLATVLVVEAWIPSGKLRFVLIADYAAYFIAGAMAFLVRAKGPSLRRLSMFGVAWILAVCEALNRLQDNEQHYRTDWNNLAVAGIVSVFFAILLLVGLGRMGSLSRRDWTALGALTYPLYLIHQNVGYAIFNAAYPTLDPDVLLWSTFALMLLGAHLIHRLVEHRLQPPMKRCMRSAFDWAAALAREIRRWPWLAWGKRFDGK